MERVKYGTQEENQIQLEVIILFHILSRLIVILSN